MINLTGISYDVDELSTIATQAATTLLPHRVKDLASLTDEQFLMELDKLSWQILEVHTQLFKNLEKLLKVEHTKAEPARIKKLQDDVAALEKKRHEMPVWKSPSHV